MLSGLGCTVFATQFDRSVILVFSLQSYICSIGFDDGCLLCSFYKLHQIFACLFSFGSMSKMPHININISKNASCHMTYNVLVSKSMSRFHISPCTLHCVDTISGLKIGKKYSVALFFPLEMMFILSKSLVLQCCACQGSFSRKS